MNSRILIPAGLLALGGIFWLAGQRREIASIREQAAALEEQLAAIPSTTLGGEIRKMGSSAAISSAAPPAGSGIDWAKLQKVGRGLLGSADYIDIRDQIGAMSAGEIIATLDELEATDLSPAVKLVAAKQFVDRLISLDPALALDRFAKFADSDPNVANKLAGAIGTWARRDSAAAMAWLDGWVAENPVYEKALSRVSRARIGFETELIGVFLPSDPSVLVGRVSAMPQEEAVELLTRFTWTGPEESHQAAFADLVRKSLPAEEGIAVVAKKAELLAETGLDATAAFLDRIQPTPAELEACIKAAVGARLESERPGQELATEIQVVRDWVDARDAPRKEQMTGVAFGHALNGRDLDFEEVAPLVLQFHTAAGNDEVLRAFLTHGGCCHGSQSLELAEKIADPATRQEIILHIEKHP